jgi:hypothetical protein
MILNPPSDRDTMSAQRRGLVDVYTAGSYISLQTPCMEEIRELYETRLPRKAIDMQIYALCYGY